MVLRLLFLFLTFPAFATVFEKQTINQQVKEADGIIIGHYLRKKYVKLDDNSVATQMIFKMNKEVGLQSELFGMDEIIVHYPGGKLGDTTVSIEGVPSFIPGEKVILMIKSHQDRYWGMNLGFGSFKVINYGNETMVVNTLFPEDRNVGQVKLEEFEKLVKSVKGSSMKVVLSPVYPTEMDRDVTREPASMKQGKNRAIASKTEQVENSENSPGLNTMWLVLILAVMGGAFRFLRQKEAN